MFEEFSQQEQGPIKPPVKTPGSDFDNFMSGSLDQLNNKYQNAYSNEPEPGTLKALTSAVDAGTKFYTTGEFDHIVKSDNFKPYENFEIGNPANEQQFALQESFFSALGKGLSGMAGSASDTFTDWFAGYSRIGEAIANWDASLLHMNQTEQIDAAYKQQQRADKNYVFLEEGVDPDGLFNKRTMAEFLTNAGYSLGTVAAFTTELAAGAALTYLSGGATGGLLAGSLGKLGAAGANIAKGFSLGNKSAEAIRATISMADDAARIANKSARVSQSARNVMNATFEGISNNLNHVLKSKNVGQAAFNASKAIPIVGDAIVFGEKIAAAGKAGYNTANLVGIGLQGGRRILQTYNMASSEASLQAVQTYSDAFDKMIQYSSSKGEVTSEDFLKAERMAMQASFSDYKTNTAILLASNAIQFDGLFKKFLPHNGLMREMFQENAENILTVTGKTAADTKLYQKGFFGTYGQLKNISKDFGYGVMTREFGKAFAKSALKFEVTEGIQENLQETSSAAWKDYYVDQYKGVEATIYDAFKSGIDEQFTQQGFKTFMMGAFTGSIVRPITYASSKVVEKIGNTVYDRKYKDNPDENPRIQAQKRIKEDIEAVNASFATMRDRSMQHSVINLARNLNISRIQADAALNNDKKTFLDLKDDALLGNLFAAQRTNTVDAFISGLRSMEDMSPEEFENAYGQSIKDLGYDSPSELFTETADRLKKYSDTLDDLRKNTLKYINPNEKNLTENQKLLAHMFNSAQEDAIQFVAYNMLKGEMNSKRAEEITAKLMKNPALMNSADTLSRGLISADNVKGEIGNALTQLKTITDQLKLVTDGEARKNLVAELDNKKEEIALLTEWLGFFEPITIKQKDETGEEIEEYTSQGNFVGSKSKEEQKIYDEAGNVIGIVNSDYNTKSDKVKDVLKRIINLKNKQLGLSTEVRDSDMTQVLDDYIDYVTLDSDVQGHMLSVDALADPKHLLKVIENINQGKIKFQIVMYLENINALIKYRINELFVKNRLQLNEGETETDAITRILSELYNSEPYKKLLVLSSQEKVDFNTKYFQAVASELSTLVEEYFMKFYDEKVATEEVVVEQPFAQTTETSEEEQDFEVPEEKDPEPTISESEIQDYESDQTVEDEEVTEGYGRNDWESWRISMGLPEGTDAEWQEHINSVKSKTTTASAEEQKPSVSSAISIVSTPSQQIISELNKLSSFQEKLKWLKEAGLLSPISINGIKYDVIDYSDRVMVLMKIGNYNIPVYISTGQAGKKNVKAGNWYVVFGIGEESGWINKGTEEDINNQYNFPLFQKIVKILNEGIGTIESREENGNGKLKEGIGFLEDSNIPSFNSQMNLPTSPGRNVRDGLGFYAHVKSTLKLLNEELLRLQNVQSQESVPTAPTDAKADINKKSTKVISSEIVEKGNRKGQTRVVTQTNSIKDVEGTLVSVTDYEAKVGDATVSLGGRRITFKEFKEEFPLDEDYEEILGDWPDLNDDTIITVRKVKRTPSSSRFKSVVTVYSPVFGEQMDIVIKENDTKYDAELAALEDTQPTTVTNIENVSQTENENENVGRVPLTITKARRQELYDLGYNKQDVNAMKPEEADDIIKNQKTKENEKTQKKLSISEYKLLSTEKIQVVETTEGEAFRTVLFDSNGKESQIQYSNYEELETAIKEYYDELQEQQENAYDLEAQAAADALFKRNEEFAAKQREQDDGYDIVDNTNVPVNPEPIKSEEKATQTAQDLNIEKEHVDFITQMIIAEGLTPEAAVVSKTISSIKKSMTAYNKKHNTSYKTFKEFNNNADGKVKILTLFNKYIKNIATPTKKAKVVNKIKSKENNNISNDFSSEPATGEEVRSNNIMSWFQSIKSEIPLENSSENVNFVKTDISLDNIFDDIDLCS